MKVFAFVAVVAIAWILAFLSVIPYGGSSAFVMIAVLLTWGLIAYFVLLLIGGIIALFQRSPEQPPNPPATPASTDANVETPPLPFLSPSTIAQRRSQALHVVLAITLLSPLWLPLVKMKWMDARWALYRERISKFCSAELARLPPTLPMDDLVDETGGLKWEDVAHLLTVVRLRAVELNLASMRSRLSDQTKSGSTQTSIPRSGYARFELGDMTSPDCFSPTGMSALDFVNRPPVRPATCLRVTYLNEPTAGFSLSERSNRANADFSDWVLTERASANEVASITDAFRKSRYPAAVPTWNRKRPQSNRCDGDDGGYTALLDRLRGSVAAVEASTSRVMSQGKIFLSGLSLKYAGVKKLREDGELSDLRSSDAPFRNPSEKWLRRPSWAEAYAASVQHGAWVYENRLVIPSKNSIGEIESLGVYGMWGAADSQLILVQATSADRGVVVFGVDFTGKTLWAAQTAPLAPWSTEFPLSFRAERFEIEEPWLYVHGTYGGPHGKENQRPWTIRLSLAELAELRVKALSKK